MLGKRPAAGLYVAVGASDAVGVGARRPRVEAWPRVLHRQAFPRASRFVNLGVSGSTVASALAGQVPKAERLEPDVVTVWLVVNDVVAGVDVDDYEAALDRVVGRLRRDGTTTVLVGNCPSLDRMPAYLFWREVAALPDAVEANRIVAGYNDAIDRVVSRYGATLVDLHAAGLAARRAGVESQFFASDGFHPSTAGHRAIAAAFAHVLTEPALQDRPSLFSSEHST
jgi:lysophospholipase L1-like esterase